MPVVTIADVLERARQFEDMLADYYAGIAHATTREGVRLLTDYMSRHRRRIDAELAELEPEQARHIHMLPIRYQPSAADCKCFAGKELPADAPAAHVLDNAICLDGCLIELYRQAAKQAPDAESQAFFQGLIRCEERDAIELKKIKALDYF